MTLASHRSIFLNGLAQTSDIPLMLEIEKAEGVWLYDVNGKRFMDMISGIGVSCLGHRHPSIMNAIMEQSSKYLHTMVYGEFVLAPQTKLASLLQSVLPPNLHNIYLVNSGSEAVEGAIKLAKRYTQRSQIIACRNAYHGSTQGAASLMDSQYFTSSFRPLIPGIKHIRFNHFLDIDLIDENTAAVIIEPIQAEAGILTPREGYLQAVKDACEHRGVLLIFDEIQTSYARTGNLFAFQNYGIVPDILLLSKGFGGGLPIGAFISSKEIMKSLSFDPVLGHLTTFGGNPLCAATAHATLEYIIDRKLWLEVDEKKSYLLDRLRHPKIIQIREAGLWMAVDLGSFEAVHQVIKLCLERGYILDWFLFNDQSIRICPPIIISIEELGQFASDFIAVLDQI